MTHKVVPCCGYEYADDNYPVYWNQWNGAVQCHNCGHSWEPASPPAAPVTSEPQEQLHASDCSLHNMPAYPNEPCDCGASKTPKTDFYEFDHNEDNMNTRHMVVDADLARDLERELAAAREGWIAVSERLPEVGVSVLVCEPDSHVQKTCHDGRDFLLPHKSRVTHWMPLPPPPKPVISNG